MAYLRQLLGIILAFCVASTALAERGALFTARGVEPLFGPRSEESARPTGSLFTGTQGRSLFAPLPGRNKSALTLPRAETPIAQLLDLIATAEAGPAGYNAVQHGAKIRPGKAPTDMSLGEIFKWIKDTPGQPHAIGRYQFIPTTLDMLVKEAGLTPATRFTPAVQDALAMQLLDDAGITAFRAGQLKQEAFMENLAQIWAGLPLPSGKSYYDGYAGNSATMTWARFLGGMEQIFPES